MISVIVDMQRIQINPKSVSISLTKDILSNRDWYEKSWAGVLNPLFLVGYGGVLMINKRIKDSFRIVICFVKHDKMHWFWDGRDLKRLRKRVLRLALAKPRVISNWINDWKKDWRAFTKVLSEFEQIKINELSDQELYAWYERFKQAYYCAGSLPYIVDSFLTSGEDDWLAEMITKEVEQKVSTRELPQVIATLTAQVYPSFSQREQLSLLKLALSCSAYKGVVRYLRHKRIAAAYALVKRLPTFKKNLTRHQQQFYWIENSYYQANRLSEKYFLGKIAQLLRAGSLKAQYSKVKYKFLLNKKRKLTLEKKLHLSHELRSILRLSENFTLWQDSRKAGVFLANDFIFHFLEIVAHRTKVPKVELYYSIDPEIEPLLLRRKVNREELRQRRICGCAFVFTPRGYCLLRGNAYDQIDQELFFGSQKNVKVITGTPASPGLVRGIVHIVNSFADLGSFKQGKILVTNNTTPDFVPVLKKAKAIITEQGGITTHAAVISRELRVPCIIGAKFATRVLKNGDMVEVDAYKGTIKILYK